MSPVEQIILAGGDTDTTGAITGALVGASAGQNAIPSDWLDGISEWPRNVAWMKAVAVRLGSGLLNDDAESSAGAQCEYLR